MNVANGLYNAPLHGGHMDDFEEGVDIVEVNLPQPEYLDRLGVECREVYRCLGRSK